MLNSRRVGVSGTVHVFVVLVLERIRRWVCGLRCPADLTGHMRSICEVSHSASVHTAACQTAAGTACGQRVGGKLRHPNFKKKKRMENIRSVRTSKFGAGREERALSLASLKAKDLSSRRGQSERQRS